MSWCIGRCGLSIHAIRQGRCTDYYEADFGFDFGLERLVIAYSEALDSCFFRLELVWLVVKFEGEVLM